ncbi:hypothetical protein GCM10010398_05320 [Streptomyces fimbriatus]
MADTTRITVTPPAERIAETALRRPEPVAVLTSGVDDSPVRAAAVSGSPVSERAALPPVPAPHGGSPGAGRAPYRACNRGRRGA